MKRVVQSRLALPLSCVLYLTACGSEPPPKPKAQAKAAPVCVFPECLKGDEARHVAEPNATDQELLAKEPLDYLGLWSVAYDLPKLEKRDEYQSTAAFKAASAKQLNAWRKGDLKPTTQLIVGKALGEFDSTYDPDRQQLTVSVPFGSASAVLETKHLSSDQDLGGIRAVRETDTADGLWFVNRRPVADTKIDGTCQPRYPELEEQSSFAVPMTPEVAKAIRGKLRIVFVVSFEMPRSVAGGEWCFAADKHGSGDAFLIKGGAMQIGSVTSYVNVRLHKVLLIGGDRVLRSESFS